MKRLLSLLLVPLLALAACGKEDPQPTFPADEQGAAMFATHAWEILDEINVTGKVDELRAITAPDCQSCFIVLKWAGVQTDRPISSDITFTPEVTTFDAATNNYLVKGELNGSTTHDDGSGNKTTEAGTTQYFITVRHSEGKWWLVDFANYIREDI